MVVPDCEVIFLQTLFRVGTAAYIKCFLLVQEWDDFVFDVRTGKILADFFLIENWVKGEKEVLCSEVTGLGLCFGIIINKIPIIWLLVLNIDKILRPKSKIKILRNLIPQIATIALITSISNSRVPNLRYICRCALLNNIFGLLLNPPHLKLNFRLSRQIRVQIYKIWYKLYWSFRYWIAVCCRSWLLELLWRQLWSWIVGVGVFVSRFRTNCFLLGFVVGVEIVVARYCCWVLVVFITIFTISPHKFVVAVSELWVEFVFVYNIADSNQHPHIADSPSYPHPAADHHIHHTVAVVEEYIHIVVVADQYCSQHQHLGMYQVYRRYCLRWGCQCWDFSEGCCIGCLGRNSFVSICLSV